MKSRHTKAHTFASRTNLSTDQSLQKSVLFTVPRRNSIFFSPTLRCFNFFATARQPTTDEYSDRTMHDSNLLQLDANEEARTGNSGFKKLAVQWLNEHLCFVASSVVPDSLVLRNRQLLKHAKRYHQC